MGTVHRQEKTGAIHQLYLLLDNLSLAQFLVQQTPRTKIHDTTKKYSLWGGVGVGQPVPHGRVGDVRNPPKYWYINSRRFIQL